MESLLRRGVRSGLYPSQLTNEELIDSADDKLFDLVLRYGDHVFREPLTFPTIYDRQSDAGEEGTFSRKDLYHEVAILHINRTY